MPQGSHSDDQAKNATFKFEVEQYNQEQVYYYESDANRKVDDMR